MPLHRGDSLLHYRLTDKLGEGGMGVVWRATDTKLGRDVAVKVLPDQLARDPDRLARFEREARLLAALNHPNIAAIYGLEQAGSVLALVMELVEGPTLAERLLQGSLPVDESLRIAKQIAQALEYAHERGVVHRDLKPANVKLRTDGAVKVLDFGLAKAMEGEGPGGDLANSPTISLAATKAGIVLGTAAYMSPEQAKGRPVDRRVDIWAFGCVLWELLTGQQLHGGETVSEVVASVLRDTPDLGSLPADTPTRVRELLRRCLTKDHQMRLRDIGEARVALEEILAGGPDPYLSTAIAVGEVGPPTPGASAPGGATAAGATRGRVTRSMVVVVGVLGVLLGAALVMVTGPKLLHPAAAPEPVRKLVVPLVENPQSPPSLPTLSPDGRTLAYVQGGRIYVRELATLEPRALPASEQGIMDLFWSPDSRMLGYLAGSKILKLDVATGAEQTVCDVREGSFTNGSGGWWLADGTIIASRAEHDGILEVSARGGDARTVVAVDSTLETDLHQPCALPDGEIAFVPHTRANPLHSLVVERRNGTRQTVVSMEGQRLATPTYDPEGYLLFARAPTNAGIWAVAYSAQQQQPEGEPFLVAPDGSRPSIAKDGTLAYLSGSATDRVRLVVTDRNGKLLTDLGEVTTSARSYWLAMSPDGNQVVTSVGDQEQSDLWLFDRARGTHTRLTFLDGAEFLPCFSPTGDRVLFEHSGKGCNDAPCQQVMLMRADGSGTVDSLAVGLTPSFTGDGEAIVYARPKPAGDWDLYWMSLQDRQEHPLVAGPDFQFDGRVSPDGRYVAYCSAESGQDEIYLKHFPSGDGRWQLSAGGGIYPRWNQSGDRLCYLHGADIMEIEVGSGPTPRLGIPTKLFTRPEFGQATIVGWPAGFDMSRDGTCFCFISLEGAEARPPTIVIVEHWLDEFRQKR